MIETGYWNTWHEIKELCTLPIINPSRITGVGRMKCRGRDKAAARNKRKWKRRTKTVKQSRRRNRRKK